jgi:hypothetical protein
VVTATSSDSCWTVSPPGDAILTAAVHEPSDPMPSAPATAAGGGTFSGFKVGVPYAAEARWILVQASFAWRWGGVGGPIGGGGDAAAHAELGVRPGAHVHLGAAPMAHLLGSAGAVDDLYQFTLAPLAGYSGQTEHRADLRRRGQRDQA